MLHEVFDIVTSVVERAIMAPSLASEVLAWWHPLPSPILPSLPSDQDPVKSIVNSRLRVDDFKLLKVIGRGAFGEVRLVSMGVGQWS